jgi:tetratricopeptide (TPR) repeat protein
VAPEQWRGEAVDARADVYAWGMLAWALLGGGIPATGKHPGLPERRRPTGALARLAEQARAEDPRARPADGAALVARLAAIRRRSRWLRGGAAAAAAVAVALALALWPRPPPLPPGPFKLAVSDADNRSGDPNLDGLGPLVALHLESSPRLSVLDRRRLLSVTRAAGLRTGERVEGEAAAQAARLAGAAALVVPTAVRNSAGYALRVEVFRPDSGEVLFRLEEQASSGGGLLAAVERLSRRVREGLRDKEPEVRTPAAEAARAVTTSLEAFRHYDEGLRCVERPSQSDSSWVFPDCEAHFRRALAIDPDFPQAWFELARLAFWAGANPEEQRALLARAAAGFERVPPRERPQLLAWRAWLDGDEAGALGAMAAAEAAFPEDGHVALARGDLLFRAERFDEAIGPLRRAWKLDPGLELAPDLLVGCLGVLDRGPPLRELADELARRPPSPGLLHAEVQARGWLGEPAAALALARRAAGAVGAGRGAREDQLEALVAAGDFEKAEALARTFEPSPLDGRRLLGNLLVLQGRLREAGPFLEPRLPADAKGWLRFVLAVRRAIPLALARDVPGVRRQVEEARADSAAAQAQLAPYLAYAGDADGALALRPALSPPSLVTLLDALVAWRRQGGAAALPGFRQLLRGEPRVVTAVVPQEATAYLAAEAALEAGDPEAALELVRRFQRFYTPLGFGRVWILPRSLLLEARILEKLGRREPAREALARLETLWQRADPGLPLLAEARALRRVIGPGAAPRRTEAP